MPALIKALCHKAIEIDTTNTAEDARCILEVMGCITRK